MAGGYTGKTLRIDLTTGKISSEDTLAKYKDYIGGTGLGYKVLWDEVPAGTKPLDPENRLIFGVGPLTGSGAPTGGRVSIVSLHPGHKFGLPWEGHMGGHWGPELKFAGWDSIIVQGKANSPVWIYIKDDKVEIRDAKKLWGQGNYQTVAVICAEVGSDCHVASIGQAGENMIAASNVMCDRSHSAGSSMGAVMGSKKLKAIAVKGTGAVKVGVDKKAFKDLIYTGVLPLMGCNNQGVVPNRPQPWSEYYSPRVRWFADVGSIWGRATPVFDTGYCTPDDLNKQGLRTHKGMNDHGPPMGRKYTTRISGCFSCNIRCHVCLDNPNVEAYGLSRYATNTCLGVSHGLNWFDPPFASGALTTDKAMLLKMVGVQLGDDYGYWADYNQCGRDFKYMKKNKLLEKYIPEKEFKAIPWKLWEEQSPDFLKFLFKAIVYKEGKLGELLASNGAGLDALPEMKVAHDTVYTLQNFKWGISKHHSSENFGQVGALVNLMANDHAQNHTHICVSANGLPNELNREIIGKEILGDPNAFEPEHDYKPMNEGKAKYAYLCQIYLDLHNSMTLCNWTMPLWVSPLKERKYRGDMEVEAKLYSAVTGIKKTRAELEQDGLRIVTLKQALNMRFMNEKDMRGKHNIISEWHFTNPKDKKPFTPGHDKLEKADFELARDAFYGQLGYDKKSGAPTKALLEKLNMKGVADELGAKGLLPG